MTKSTGLGDNFYIGGYNLSSDVNALGNISGGPALLESTGIDKSAIERLGGERSGLIEFTSFFDDQAGQEHPILSTLPRTDTQAMYFRGTTIGNQAAALVAKQVNYDGTRPTDGSFTLAVQTLSNAYGLEWGLQLTAGSYTATGGSSTPGSYDTAASLAFGAQAYLQVFSFAGTDISIKVQDSADDSNWTTITGFTFTTVTAAPTFERLATANTATIRRYLRVLVTTVGGYTDCKFAVMVNKNAIAGQVF